MEKQYKSFSIDKKNLYKKYLADSKKKELKEKLSLELIEVLDEIISCPHGVDSATIPKAGINAAPEQVILQYSIAYLRYKKALKLLKKAKKVFKKRYII